MKVFFPVRYVSRYKNDKNLEHEPCDVRLRIFVVALVENVLDVAALPSTTLYLGCRINRH